MEWNGKTAGMATFVLFGLMLGDNLDNAIYRDTYRVIAIPTGLSRYLQSYRDTYRVIVIPTELS